MAANKISVPVIGFSSQMLAGWPTDLRPTPIAPGDLTVGQLVVVHANAFSEYSQSVGALKPQALLYLDSGSPPQNAWRYFSGTLRPGEWDKLRATLQCPDKLELTGIAEEITVADIAPALALLATAAYEPGALDKLALPAGVDPALLGRLAQQQNCRAEFAAALRARQEWLYRTLHPPIEQLSAFSFGADDPWVAAHIPSCSICAAEIEVLRLLDAPTATGATAPQAIAVPTTPAAILLEFPLKAAHEVAINNETIQNDQLLSALIADLANSPNDLQSLAPWIGSLSAVTQNTESALTTEGSLLFIGAERELSLGWSLAAGAVTIQDLRLALGEPVPSFTALLLQNNAVLWQADSDQGSLNIPLDELAIALQAGAQNLRIVSN